MKLHTRDIQLFEEGVTYIGGSPQYQVEIRRGEGTFSVKRIHSRFCPTAAAVRDARETFLMPEERYGLISCRVVKGGLKMIFRERTAAAPEMKNGTHA